MLENKQKSSSFFYPFRRFVLEIGIFLVCVTLSMGGISYYFKHVTILRKEETLSSKKAVFSVKSSSFDHKKGEDFEYYTLLAQGDTSLPVGLC